MGQAEVMKFLEENKGQKFTAKQIACALGINVHDPLRKLKKHGDINWEIGQFLYHPGPYPCVYWVN